MEARPHSNNVYHHGDDAIWFVLWTPKQDEQDVWLEQQEVNGALTGTGEEVRIKNEDGSPYRPVLTKGYKHVWLAGKGSPGSGNDNCFMRYDNMNAYVSSNLPHTRYRADEQVGFEMCSSPVGTGVNKADRLPESRYGDAAPYRGDCVHQILVNDAVSARIR